MKEKGQGEMPPASEEVSLRGGLEKARRVLPIRRVCALEQLDSVLGFACVSDR